MRLRRELAGDHVGPLYFSGMSIAGPEMMSGVRASSIRNRVDLVDDRVVEVALDLVLDARLHVVAQVVEAEFVVRAVDDVAAVDGVALVRRHGALDRAEGEPHVLVDRAHPVRVTARQVVVHRDQVHRLSGERVQVERQRRHQRLALARRHLGDRSLVKHNAADQLHVEGAHPKRPHRGLAHQGIGLGEDVVELDLAGRDGLLPFLGLGLEGVRVQTLGPGLELVDLFDKGLELAHEALVAGAEHRLHPAADAFAEAAEPVREVFPVHFVESWRVLA